MAKALKANGMKKCIGCFTCMQVCAAVNHHTHSLARSAIKIKTMGGFTGGFTAVFCHACQGERACMEACPSGALDKRKGGGVTFHKELCIECGKCEEACIVGAVMFDNDDHSPIICKHCGMCARFCPHNCLKLEEVCDA